MKESWVSQHETAVLEIAHWVDVNSPLRNSFCDIEGWGKASLLEMLHARRVIDNKDAAAHGMYEWPPLLKSRHKAAILRSTVALHSQICVHVSASKHIRFCGPNRPMLRGSCDRVVARFLAGIPPCSYYLGPLTLL
jgi:hypothetical protein